MSTESDWLAGAEEKPRATGGRKRTNGAGDRSRKLECPDCGFICRTSAGAVERAGFPTCGCGTRLELPNLRDRIRLDEDGARAELGRYSLREQNRIYRELGYLDLVIPLDGAGKISAGGSNIDGFRSPQRCSWDGGYCMKFVHGRYCPEHDPGKAGGAEHRAYRLERGA